ncbi:hypothetical protein [Corynebacterium doosanense]|uniref:Secreted protein n=1 Tax=Corynebacterium doosanense CAU 212 = DSM 45436 TaxID=558173 RepID=A0A097IEU3_9CORY|nr:hypothetical protein [Corynebacterium doosanense]AIT60645.1 hypothetical protein CDOO_04805 [Corynebacterium doosanense CAU 212 = DSM 45436]
MTSRIPSALALVAAAGLTLSACHPPHQNDSAEKVDTATSQNPDSLGVHSSEDEANSSHETSSATTTTTTARAAAEDEVMFINCFGEPSTEPTAVSTDCTNPAAQITGVTWDEWTEESATGHGTAPNGSTSEIELSEPTDTGTNTVFTVVTVEDVVVAN